jgi:hypothetical protein
MKETIASSWVYRSRFLRMNVKFTLARDGTLTRSGLMCTQMRTNYVILFSVQMREFVF